MLLLSTAVLLAVLLPGPRAPLRATPARAVLSRARPSFAVASVTPGSAVARPASAPPLPSRKQIEAMGTLVELHAALDAQGADVEGRRKAPLRDRLLALLVEAEEEAAGDRDEDEDEDESGLQHELGEGEVVEFDAAAAPPRRGLPRRESAGAFLPRRARTSSASDQDGHSSSPAWPPSAAPPSAAAAGAAPPLAFAAAAAPLSPAFAAASALVTASALSAPHPSAPKPALQLTPEVLKPSKIQRGDYVIHKAFGIGRFEGLYKKREITIQVTAPPVRTWGPTALQLGWPQAV